ncbi:unnamed protein product [Enterobius vermicularis]|uniref:Mitochondrial GTPase 1 n=1 Tax=Enterobius vermicularis TaxID=51028 RepID=A0A0N4UWZ2_ENTVE|nr:unnamed protein product [Enterobius vermicularis]
MSEATWTSSELKDGEGRKFRTTFEVPRNLDLRKWFPMHMAVQWKKMEGKLRSVDLIIEVHDARLPITGRNTETFSSLFAVRPHVLVMNKMDLIDLKIYKKPIEAYYAKNGVKDLVWTNCKQRLKGPIHELQSKLADLLTNTPRFNRTVKTEFQVMVIGIPNVGKSSLINTMRNANLGMKASAVAEGARPGVTVRVQNRVKILNKPPIYVLDTPGLLSPRLNDIEETMKLALCNLIKEGAAPTHYIADYLLYWLNKTGDFSYVKNLGLEKPYDSIKDLVVAACQAQNWKRTVVFPGKGVLERWDFDRAEESFVEMFRKGRVSDQCLDKDLLL